MSNNKSSLASDVMMCLIIVLAMSFPFLTYDVGKLNGRKEAIKMCIEDPDFLDKQKKMYELQKELYEIEGLSHD